MYVPAPFVEADRSRLFDLIESHPFGLLVTAGEDGPMASHVPFLLDRESGILSCHLAKANPQGRMNDGTRALCVFRGPHAYVSPRYYVSRRVVPTWVYIAVHAGGPVRRMTDSDRLHALATAMSARFEAGADDPWSPDKAPKGHVERMIGGIVGLEITIETLEGARKLDQHKTPEDRASVRAALAAAPDADSRAIAAAMDEIEA